MTNEKKPPVAAPENSGSYATLEIVDGQEMIRADFSFEQLFGALFPHVPELSDAEISFLSHRLAMLVPTARALSYPKVEDFAGRLVKGLDAEARRRGHQDGVRTLWQQDTQILGLRPTPGAPVN